MFEKINVSLPSLHSIQGYKVYYTTNPNLPLPQWQSQFGDSNRLTTISDLTPHTIYTIRVEAYTAVGPGPPSIPVQVAVIIPNFADCKKTKRFCNIPSVVNTL